MLNRQSLKGLSRRETALAILALPLVSVLAGSLFIVTSSAPAPILPSLGLYQGTEIGEALKASSSPSWSDDFRSRPLLAPSRRPNPGQGSPDEDDQEVAGMAAENATIADSIDGISLLGIFKSGEISGVFVRLDDGQRVRVDKGEKVRGWELKSLSRRRATLESEAGELSVLYLAFSNEQDPLADTLTRSSATSRDSVRQSRDSIVDAVSKTAEIESASDGAQSKSEISTPRPLTFDMIYQRRYGDGKNTEPQRDEAVDNGG